MRFQPIYDIAELCARKGLRKAVLCPGSRCAPLVLPFTRHPEIESYTISDERSAAFIALGMSQQLKKPAVLVCTSGSAVYNFAPAVAEAFFNQVPMVIITADRPVEWVNQHDGQTIYQTNIFGSHVKQSWQLPQHYDHADDQWVINRMVNEAINVAQQEPKGPVHINAPFREPLYPSKEDVISFSKNVRVIENATPALTLPDEVASALTEELKSFRRILIVAGQIDKDANFIKQLDAFSSRYGVPVVGEIISNMHTLKNVVSHADNFLGDAPDEIKKSLQPDLLITFGKSVLSKNLKLFLRRYLSVAHWHINPGHAATDTFQHLTKVIHLEPSDFFSLLTERNAINEKESQKAYRNAWDEQEKKATKIISDYFATNQGEFGLVGEVLRQLPAECNLHLANSMSVRYANFIGLEKTQQGVTVWCNRGTSGIDGCSSTTVGHSLTSSIPNVLITGDLAFFYDRNAFWHNYVLPNLRVVLLNNHGGVIFKIIDGPKELPEADEYFVTRQRLSAENLCREFGFRYCKLQSGDNPEKVLSNFFDAEPVPKLLELETDAKSSKEIFDNFKKQIKTNYEL